MANNFTQQTKRYMLLFLSIFPIFDAISGMSLQGKISYGQSVLPVASTLRIVFILLVLVMIANTDFLKNPGVIMELILLFLGLATFIIQKMYFNYSISALFSEVSVYGKYVFWFTVFIFFYLFRDSITLEDTKRVILLINVTFLIGLFVPYILGTGTATYDGNAGFKGWYYGPNDSSYTLITIALMTLYNYDDLKMYLLQVFNIAGLLLLGTKTAMISAGILFVLIVIKLLLSKYWVKKVIGADILIASILAISFFQQLIYQKLIYPMVNRLTYFYFKYDGDWTKLIFSGRSTALTDDFKILSRLSSKTFGILFGYGYNYRGHFFPYHNGLIEFDMADVLFSYGIVNLAFLIFLIVFVFLATKKHREMYLFFFIFSIIYADIAGHVLFSAMSGTIFGVIAGCLILQSNNDDQQIVELKQ